MIRIIDIDNRIGTTSSIMKLGQPLETAYPKLEKLRFAVSRGDLVQAVNWMWLQSHKGTPNQEIMNVVVQIIKRSLAFYRALNWDSSRDSHDFVLLNVAILAGNRQLMEEALDYVSEADAKVGQPDYWRALNGILKFMLVGDASQAERQYEILCLCKGKEPMIRAAKKVILKSFIAGDVGAIQRQIQGVVREFWTNLQQSSGVGIPNVKCDMDITLGVRDHNRYWPWPEAAILKLMAQNGMEFETDEFWLPTKLISGEVDTKIWTTG